MTTILTVEWKEVIHQIRINTSRTHHNRDIEKNHLTNFMEVFNLNFNKVNSVKNKLILMTFHIIHIFKSKSLT